MFYIEQLTQVLSVCIMLNAGNGFGTGWVSGRDTLG